MRQVGIRGAESQMRLEASISGLADRAPHVSAQASLSNKQRRLLMIAVGLTALGLVIAPRTTLIVLVSIVTGLYLALAAYRFRLFVRAARDDSSLHISDREARAVASHSLPMYTVLIPAYNEPEVINHLIDHIARLDYPIDRLQVLLLVEADDDRTIEAIGSTDPGPQFSLVFVPPSQPRTKPKALNYGLTFATGDLIAVYDAEDIPEPLQLRRAAIAMSRLPPSYGCLQSRLSYHNPMQNLITKWFTIEYSMWFTFFLPGLASMDAPIPLGGTSNHFRRAALRSMGAWDPFNVTEDADLGVRMRRAGYRTGILDSTTYEEANSDFVNWVRQRSRWYKGYFKTFLVHLRNPRELVADVGWRGTAHLCLFVGGTPTLALLNPVFWVMTGIWFFVHPAFIQKLFPGAVYSAAMLSLTIGNFLLVYLTVISCRLVRRGDLLPAALLVPLYWGMMSLAAVKAAWQLLSQPGYWEKTFHGLAPESEVELTHHLVTTDST